MNVLEIEGLTFQYKGQEEPVLRNLNLTAGEGRILALTGPSGCGKSTLGCCIAGVIPRLIEGEFSGEIRRRGRVGIVFQDPDTQVFLPTVLDEAAFGPENLCLPRDEIGGRIDEVLEITGISHLRQRNPGKLSGGQKQLTALAGVLALSPDLIVLDEALAQLDGAARERMKEVLVELRQRGKTLFMIEHEERNLDIADEVLVLSRGVLSQAAILPVAGGSQGSQGSQGKETPNG